MITRSEHRSALKRSTELLSKAGVAVREDELGRMEVADFGLSELQQSGAQIITLVETDQIAAKLLVLLPHQTVPEHLHPPLGDYAGKQETIRCEWGELYLYGPGEPTANPRGRPPKHRLHTYTVWHEYLLLLGEQVTFAPNTPHWFQGGPEGAVIWSFSSRAEDVQDVFTDPKVVRQTGVVND